MAAVIRFAAGLILLASLGGPAPAADLPLEYAVKASYLYKFAPFVQWPPAAFETPTSPLSICIAGQDPFGPALGEAVRGQHVNGHPIVVRRIESVHPGIACQILFVGGSETAEALQAVAHEPVLTVTDHNRGGAGGMIQFIMMAGRVRFMVDQAAAQDSGIAISSKLLGLAVSVNK
jgi:YfiR/HmsC-like